MTDERSSRPDPAPRQRAVAAVDPAVTPDTAERALRSELLDALSRALAEVSLDHEAALDVAVRGGCELLGDSCLILAPVDHGARGTVVQALAIHAGDDDARTALLEALRAPPLHPGEPLARQLLATAHPLLASPGADGMAALLAGRDAPVRDLGLHSLLAVALRAGGQELGSLLLARHATSRPFDLRDLELAQALADRAAPALRSARVYEENLRQTAFLRRDNRELERRIAERTAELELATAEIARIAIDDGLTGLANRRHFDEMLDREHRRAQRDGSYLTLLLFDLDLFRRYNARHGRMAGDACLRSVGSVLRGCFRRAADMTARYGGEEFAVILPGCPPATARATAERARAAVSGARASGADIARAGGITVSVGAVSAHVTAETSAAWFIERASDALARSKAAGRNCVTISADPSGSRTHPTRG